MHHKEDSLREEYQRQKRALEEQEETLLRQRDRGLSELDDMVDKARYYFGDFADDYELQKGIMAVSTIKEELMDTVQQERRSLERQLEETEEKYYRGLRQLETDSSK